MKNKLVELLESLGFKAYLQGSFTTNKDYPASFFTYWNFETDIDKYFSNFEYRCIWSFWINFYSCEEDVDKMMEKARKMLKDNGWIVRGKGQDSNSDNPDYAGRELEIYYIEY